MYMAYTTNPRLPAVRRDAADLVRRGWSTRQVARHLGYSQAAVVQWCKKARVIGYHPIPTKSSRPHHHPRELTDEVVKKIVEIRCRHNRSAEVVHEELLRSSIVVSISSVKRTLDRWNLLKKRSPWKRYHAPMPRPEVTKPGDLVQLDTIHLMVDRIRRVYVFTLIDVYSRWAYARAYELANTHTALDFLRRAHKKASFTFNHLQSDHGSEFSTTFTERSRIAHRHSRVRMPNDNAHLERFNRTIQEECLDRIPRSVDAINRAMDDYLPYYNSERLHFGLFLKTPVEILAKPITSY